MNLILHRNLAARMVTWVQRLAAASGLSRFEAVTVSEAGDDTFSVFSDLFP